MFLNFIIDLCKRAIAGACVLAVIVSVLVIASEQGRVSEIQRDERVYTQLSVRVNALRNKATLIKMRYESYVLFKRGDAIEAETVEFARLEYQIAQEHLDEYRREIDEKKKRLGVE